MNSKTTYSVQSGIMNTTRSVRAAGMVFTKGEVLPQLAENPRVRLDVLRQIHEDVESLRMFQELQPNEQEVFLQFCIGNRNLKVTYDPFFRSIFHPEKHPGRLDSFLSSVMGQPVKVRAILPREGTRLSAEASFMAMDVLVELADGSMVNVEMQRIGYHFPIERTFCYGADMLVRQYDRIRANQEKDFAYDDMKPVFVIVLMEKSPAFFRKQPGTYLYRSEFRLNNDTQIPNLLNFVYIALDYFLEMPHNELTELEAWLYFLSSDNPLHIRRIIEKYPFFRELYQDIIDFRKDPKELIRMFSESLSIADKNTIKLMVDELRDEKAVLENEMAELESEKAELESEKAELKAVISTQANEIAELKKRLAEAGL